MRHSYKLAWLPRTLSCNRTPPRVVPRGGLRSLLPVLGASIFVAVPESWLPCVTSAGAEPTIVRCAPILDYIAVVVRLRFSVLTWESICAMPS